MHNIKALLTKKYTNMNKKKSTLLLSGAFVAAMSMVALANTNSIQSPEEDSIVALPVVDINNTSPRGGFYFWIVSYIFLFHSLFNRV